MMLPSSVAVAAGTAAYALVLFIEDRRPLRLPTQKKWPRVVRNLSLGALGSFVLRIGFYPALLRLCAVASERRWGLLHLGRLPGWLQVAAGVVFLDYALYFWHWANHKVPFFWRFHNAHHVDLDLDISTGSRFHFGELILSVGVRALEIVVLGVGPAAMLLYDAVVMAAVHFHHSNVRLPEALDRALAYVIVTPRMHGIHHSIVRRETDSNFSTVLSFWDRLHRSLRLNIPQSEITIGVPSFRRPEELTFLRILALPFGRRRPWALPDGTIPDRRERIS